MKRLDCLDGLRGVLAVYVMLSHMAPFAALPPAVQSALSHGGAGVDVFFMLSGLVIVRSLESHGYAARPFLIARIARIFPVYLPVLALALAVQKLPVPFAAMPWLPPDGAASHIQTAGWPAAWPIDLAAHLTMTHGLFPDGIRPDAWVAFLGAAWSLSTEWQFYLLALAFGRGGQIRLALLFLLLAAGGLTWDRMTPEAWHFSRAFLPNKAHCFALGIASAAWLNRRCHASLLLVLLATLAISAAGGRVEKTLPPLLWMLCLTAQTWSVAWPVAALLRARPVQWLGTISYPLYLVNEPIQKTLGMPLARMAHGDAGLFTLLWLPAAALLPVGAAALAHRYLETPGMRLGRQVIAPQVMAPQVMAPQVMAPLAATGHTHSTRPARTPTYQS
jgi:peptidoglycan/LPS O-acetylase OafA/YrhL